MFLVGAFKFENIGPMFGKISYLWGVFRLNKSNGLNPRFGIEMEPVYNMLIYIYTHVFSHVLSYLVWWSHMMFQGDDMGWQWSHPTTLNIAFVTGWKPCSLLVLDSYRPFLRWYLYQCRPIFTCLFFWFIGQNDALGSTCPAHSVDWNLTLAGYIPISSASTLRRWKKESHWDFPLGSRSILSNTHGRPKILLKQSETLVNRLIIWWLYGLSFWGLLLLNICWSRCRRTS